MWNWVVAAHLVLHLASLLIKLPLNVRPDFLGCLMVGKHCFLDLDEICNIPCDDKRLTCWVGRELGLGEVLRAVWEFMFSMSRQDDIIIPVASISGFFAISIGGF